MNSHQPAQQSAIAHYPDGNANPPELAKPLSHIKTPLGRELDRRAAAGSERLSVAEFGARFKSLGYTLDRSLDCRCTTRIMTGERAGETYPTITTGIYEADTGLSFANRDVRRDDKFRALQKMRGEIFAVSNGAILEA